jgi:anti-sigma factor RsiW
MTGASVLTCQDAIRLMLDYLEAALTPEVLEAFGRHLEACEPCVAYLNTYRRTRDLTGQVARVPMPEEMKARLRDFLMRHLPPAEDSPAHPAAGE